MCSVLLLVEIEENRWPVLLLVDGQPRFEGVFTGLDGFALLIDWVREQGMDNAYVRLRAQSAAAISQALLLAVFFDQRGWTVGLDAPLTPAGGKAPGRQGRRRPAHPATAQVASWPAH